jgi:hypothetical protein
VFDVTTAAGRKLCISQAGKVAKTKTAVDKLGKALSDSLNVERAKVMADRRIYNDGLSELKLEVRQPVTDWEAAEEAKLEAVEQAFECLATNSEANNVTGELFSNAVLQAKLAALESCDLSVFCDESDLTMAQARIFAGKTKIRAAIQQRKDADELAELRRLKAEQVAKDEKAEADKLIADAAIAKYEEIQKQKQQILDTGVGHLPTPRTRVEVSMPPVKPAPEPSKQPWADAAMPRTALAINAAAIDDLCKFGRLESGQARTVLAAISAGEIRNLSINY